MKKTRYLFAWLFMLAAMPVFVACGDDDAPSGIHTGNAVAVDLGLPSGTKWANMNVGATKPEEAGDYFRWAETKPFVEGDTNETYPYDGVDLGESIAGTKYDAATANLGAPWKMPTNEQWQELANNCTYTWTTQNGVNGGKFTGPNGASIFFPASGCCYGSGGSHSRVGSYGSYWSATPGSSGGRRLSFDSGSWYWRSNYQTYGFPVRAVAK